MSIPETSRMHVSAIIAAIPRRSIKDFKDSIRELNSEERQYLKQELSILVTRGKEQYQTAYDSL